MPLDRPTVRRLLDKLLRSDSDLDAFCLDYFPEVHRRFTNGMDRVRKVNILFEQIEIELAPLVDTLRRAYPDAVKDFERSLGIAPTAPQAASSAPPATPSTPSPATSLQASSSHDPALDDLQRAYTQGNLVVFVGAGISAGAGLPSWKRLVELLSQHPRVQAAAPAVRDEINDFAAQYRFIDALSAIKETIGRKEFCSLVEKHLDDRGRAVPPAAKAVAALQGKLRAVLTTNIDHLLEQAFAGAWPALTKATGDIAQRRGYILKLHGTLLDHGSWVFTRDEYDRALYNDPLLQGAFSSLFHACSILFVGYGLMDDDFDQVLARVRALAGPQPPRHFALTAASSVKPFRRRTLEDAGIRIIEYPNPNGTHSELVRILQGVSRVP